MNDAINLAEQKPVHLVCFIVDHFQIWIGWQFVDEPNNPVLKKDRNILWATSKNEMMKKCLISDPSQVFEEEFILDLNSIQSRIDKDDRSVLEAVLDAWNMFTDVRNSLDLQRNSFFPLGEEQWMQTYDRLFASTSAADLVDFKENDCDDFDMIVASEMIRRGIAMLLNLTILSKH